jgi:uncharacterized protein YndB with AHSA1/START domain
MATTTRSTFRRSVSVTTDIAAPPQKVWSLLTDADHFPQWNSTVTRIEGPIEAGRRLRITVPVSTRAFTPTVAEFEPHQRMVWRDGKAPMFTGNRVFELAPVAGGTRFTMTETFEGVMLPLIARTLPDFVPIFDQYAADLSAAATTTATPEETNR